MNQHLTKLSNLQQRIIAALIGGIAIIGAIYWNQWGYFGVFFLICGFTLREFYQLVGLDGNAPLTYYGTFTGLCIFLLTFLIEKKLIGIEHYFWISPIASVIFFIKLYKKNEKKPFTNIAFTFLGIIYVAIPFSLLNICVFLEDAVYSYQVILGCLFLLWASDTGAYFAGTYFGRTKLFERVSPKKSWEGSIGGLCSALIVASLLAYFFTDLKYWHWYCIAIIIVVAGTYGDLVESLFKRSMDIKDSGASIPGHGGFLDRFDGLLLSAPFIVTFLRIFA
ncbi:phosphatidate cytidylyltransferase [Cytophagaceae bacterium DM2B3-1]|uniref:Phosphatidate cytidylyltransferase n=1 Tax=Xanthocytophaga flava TaxID=3048013 RepID=A0AAE3U9X9_9BACT|nr:phosphatidate cytidylyltransferase [Xanthocytophaga flavus]MDJ1482194.1 phosphatidate cytidylyltransferase [Xanthocytophaga flavus]MDJ1491744.1 phosphatidate cytidylyltransferase [Xanthocytophaga flavus]